MLQLLSSVEDLQTFMRDRNGNTTVSSADVVVSPKHGRLATASALDESERTLTLSTNLQPLRRDRGPSAHAPQRLIAFNSMSDS